MLRIEAPKEVTLPEDLEPKTQGGGGSFGRGPIDDDGGDRWRRDGDGDENRGPLLIALGILSLGAAVLTARLLAEASARGRVSRR